jgi:RimJ/RimL family protein N-acetyltransferase
LAWEPDRPVGYVDCGTFDRFVEWEGGPGGRGVLDSIPVPTATLGYAVDPSLRRRGYGTAMLDTLTMVPDLIDIRLFVAGVEPANVGSVGCLLEAGYRPLNAKLDWEGMVYYARLRTVRSDLA